MAEQSRGAGQPLGPRRPGPVLKAGWLRKQRGIMKNWQPRWFVLRGDQLLYYKDKDETKPQVRSPCPVSRGSRAGLREALLCPGRGGTETPAPMFSSYPQDPGLVQGAQGQLP